MQDDFLGHTKKQFGKLTVSNCPGPIDTEFIKTDFEVMPLTNENEEPEKVCVEYYAKNLYHD